MLQIIFYAMGILLGIGVLAKLISTFTVRKMVKEAGEIQKSNHKLMRLIKAKFEHASLVSDRVLNVGAFVDKYLYEYKVMGIRLNTWRNLPKKMTLIIGILGIFSVFESFRVVGFKEQTLFYIQWTSIFVLLLLLLHFLSNENTRLQAARNYMVEYLENVCIHRYAKMNKMPEEPNTQTEPMQDPMIQPKAPVVEPEFPVQPQITEPEPQITLEVEEEESRSEQEMRIRAILEEFLA